MMKRLMVLPAALLLALVLGQSPALAAPGVPISRTQKLTLKLNATKTIRFTEKATRIHVIDPQIADIRAYSRSRLTVQARGLGQTNIHVVFKNHQVILLVTVVR